MNKYDYRIHGSDLRTYSEGYVVSRSYKEASAKISGLRNDLMVLHDDHVVMYFEVLESCNA